MESQIKQKEVLRIGIEGMAARYKYKLAVLYFLMPPQA